MVELNAGNFGGGPTTLSISTAPTTQQYAPMPMQQDSTDSTVKLLELVVQGLSQANQLLSQFAAIKAQGGTLQDALGLARQQPAQHPTMASPSGAGAGGEPLPSGKVDINKASAEQAQPKEVVKVELNEQEAKAVLAEAMQDLQNATNPQWSLVKGWSVEQLLGASANPPVMAQFEQTFVNFLAKYKDRLFKEVK